MTPVTASPALSIHLKHLNTALESFWSIGEDSSVALALSVSDVEQFSTATSEWAFPTPRQNRVEMDLYLSSSIGNGARKSYPVPCRFLNHNSHTNPDAIANDVRKTLSSLKQALREESVRMIYGSLILHETTALIGDG